MSDTNAASQGGIPAAAIGSFDAMPKASIGNYKGVMLCNRPFAGASAGAPPPGRCGELLHLSSSFSSCTPPPPVSWALEGVLRDFFATPPT